VKRAGALRARYLEALTDDEENLRSLLRKSTRRNIRGIADAHAAIVDLLHADREPIYRREPSAKKRTWRTALLEKVHHVIAFANENLEQSSADRRATLDAMLRANLTFAVPAADRFEYLQEEVRQTLDDICATDPFARDKLYRALESEAFRKGMRVVGGGPLHDMGHVVVPNPARFSLAWGYSGNGWRAATIPYDLRSALFVEIGRMLTSRKVQARIRKCPMCGTYLIARGRQRFCPGRCKADADVVRRRLLRQARGVRRSSPQAQSVPRDD
jgi:ribosomal protein S27AE